MRHTFHHSVKFALCFCLFVCLLVKLLSTLILMSRDLLRVILPNKGYGYATKTWIYRVKESFCMFVSSFVLKSLTCLYSFFNWRLFSYKLVALTVDYKST